MGRGGFHLFCVPTDIGWVHYLRVQPASDGLLYPYIDALSVNQIGTFFVMGVEISW